MVDPVIFYISVAVVAVCAVRIWLFMRSNRRADEQMRQWKIQRAEVQARLENQGLYLIDCKAAGCSFIARGFDVPLVDAAFEDHWLTQHAVRAPINDPAALQRWLLDD